VVPKYFLPVDDPIKLFSSLKKNFFPFFDVQLGHFITNFFPYVKNMQAYQQKLENEEKNVSKGLIFFYLSLI